MVWFKRGCPPEELCLSLGISSKGEEREKDTGMEGKGKARDKMKGKEEEDRVAQETMSNRPH